VNHRTRTTLLAGMVSAAALLLTACSGDDPFAGRELSISGPEDGALYNADQLGEVSLEVRRNWPPTPRRRRTPTPSSTSTTSGCCSTPRTSPTRPSGWTPSWCWTPGELEDGAYQLAVVRVPLPDPEAVDDPDAEVVDVDPASALEEGRTPGRSCSRCGPSRWTSPHPSSRSRCPTAVSIAGEPVLISGTTEPGSLVTVGGVEVTTGEDGSLRGRARRAAGG
jgi:hypothetical protein